MAKNNQPILLTVREVAAILRIHRPKVYDLIHEGIIMGFKLGSDWRIKRESIERLVGPIPTEFFSSKRLRGEEPPSEMSTKLKVANT